MGVVLVLVVVERGGLAVCLSISFLLWFGFINSLRGGIQHS